jgi:hypothetical protein
MFFPLGGGTLKGISQPGEIAWSRFFIMNGQLHANLGRGSVVDLPEAEIQDRWKSTNEGWPMMNARLHGVSRDQMMACLKANHINVAYAADVQTADRALAVKAAMLEALGIRVHLCGEVKGYG